MAKLQIGFLLFPNVTQLDFTGPLQVMSRIPDSAVHIIAKTRDLVPSDCGLDLMPTTTMAACPDLDVLCIPGGFGVSDAMADKETVDFVRRQGGQARYATSVCTGTFLLGAAGLLKGKAATTHWAFTELLESVGARHQKARVVKDGNIVTAGGVTSGIDFGLEIVAEIAGPAIAQAIQLGIEYDPAPPFDSGHPDKAKSAVMEMVSGRYKDAVEDYRQRIDALPA